MNCGGNLITDLQVSNCPKLRHLDRFGNEISKLEISSLPNLTTIDCSHNQIVSELSISNCPKLGTFRIADNLLSNLNFLNIFDPEILTYLDISDNNIEEQNLSAFSKFTNLIDLWIGNDKERIKEGKKNQFFGSLKYLAEMENLQWLYISNTEINGGLEYLSTKLQSFSYSKTPLQEKLGETGEDISEYFRSINLLNNWRKINKDLVEKAEKELSAKSTVVSSKKSKNAKQKTKLNNFQEQIQQLQSELEQERAKNNSLQKEHIFYKNFFDNHLEAKKQELLSLKNKLNEEEQEWLETYFEAQQEADSSAFAKRQLAKSKEKLNKKLTDEELKVISSKQKEITELEQQLESLQVQEQLAQIEISPK